MGGCVSVSIPCDPAVNHVSNCLCGEASYIHKLEENLEALETGMQELKQLRADLQRKVDVAENRGLQLLEIVKGWLSSVDAIDQQVDELLNARNAEIQRLCLCDYCSKNCISTYHYGKKVFKKRREVETLKSKGVFEAVAEAVPTPRISERPIQPTVGTETMLERAWNRLMEDGVGILGLYGMGGVGKTTLLTQINNKFCKTQNNFDMVIWVVVSKDLQIDRIQEEIGKKLYLSNEEWKQKERHEKADGIYNVLRKKKFVLLLDDVWEKATLKEIGVPYPNRENGCKVAFTARSREVCSRMGANAEMEVECLAPDVSWDLFREKIGESTLNSHPEIPELARIVVKKCRGLPLALNVIGEAMACKKTVQEWRGAVDTLSSSAAKFSGMTDEILPILEFSYDNLEGDKIKSCFLYCALFPEDYQIPKESLTEYWLGEGIIDGNEDWDRAENEAYDIIGTLVRACLLMEGDDAEFVQMHDVVREMALWIVSESRRREEYFFVKAGGQLRQIPRVEDWKAVKRMSLSNNQVENISGSPNCPILLTLFIRNNKLRNISGAFFLFMPNLVVLDLSGNRKLTWLPEENSKLISLQYLNLNATGIEQLPVSLKELRKLIFLDLGDTKKLQSIVGISSLSNLQILRLCGSDVPLNLSSMEELQLLERLQVLTITLTDASVLERFLSIHKLVSCTRVLDLQGFTSALDGTLLATLYRLRSLEITDSDTSEIKIDWEGRGSKMVSPLHNRASPSNPYFRNLHEVTIYKCGSLRDLTWLLFVPHLTYLNVGFARQIEEIISRRKAIALSNGQPNTIPFSGLKGLLLVSLDELKSIYWSPLSFPCLMRIYIIKCPKLRKLPLNSESARGRNLRIDATKEWMEGLEWEDEATKERFFPG